MTHIFFTLLANNIISLQMISRPSERSVYVMESFLANKGGFLLRLVADQVNKCVKVQTGNFKLINYYALYKSKEDE